VIASCDAFNINASWLRALLWEAESGARCAVAQDSEGTVHPLCGIYRSECRPIVTAALSEGRLRMMDLLKELDARLVKVDGVLLNLNTPEQYHEIVDEHSRR
jgi:molybdopterin-guanine dinucleotide biosynthesis protein A